MKTAAVFAALMALASTGYAGPVAKARNEQVADSFFGGDSDGNRNGVIGDIFDSAACVVGSFVGGDLCFQSQGNGEGKGKGATKSDSSSSDSSSSSSSSSSDSSSSGDDSSSSASSSQYNFNYSTNSDGSYKVKIEPSSGDDCTYNIDGKGKKVQEVVDIAAKRCLK